MIILDTNIFSVLMRTDVDPAVADWIERQREEALATTTVTAMEIRYGLELMPRGKRRSAMEAHFEKLISPTEGFEVLELVEEAAQQAGVFLAHRQAIGRPAKTSDMMIAGIVASAGATLATRNVRDFADLPLRIENPYRDDPAPR